VLDDDIFTPVDPRIIKHITIMMLQGHEGKGSETITAANVGKTSKVLKIPGAVVA
jgi:hypothetical protein